MSSPDWKSGPQRSTFPTEWIRAVSTRLPRSESAVLIYLATWIRKGASHARMGVQRIALETGLPLRSVERGLAGLKRKGLITRTRQQAGRVALTELHLDAIESLVSLDSGGSAVMESSHGESVTPDPPEMADLDPPLVADLDPPPVADLGGQDSALSPVRDFRIPRNLSEGEETDQVGTGREESFGLGRSAALRSVPEESGVKTEEDGSMLDSERVPPTRKRRQPRGPKGAHLLASVLREELKKKWPGRSWPSVDMKELGIWAKLRDDCGEDAAVATVRWAVRNWEALIRRFRLDGFPSASVIMGFRASWVPEATAAPAQPTEPIDSPEVGWR